MSKKYFKFFSYNCKIFNVGNCSISRHTPSNLSKLLFKKCCKNIDEESDDDIQQTPPIPNPKFSPGQLSLVLLMVMHTPPSFITSTAEIEDQEKEEPGGHRTRHSCAKKLNLSKTSVVYERYFFTLCFFVVHY